MVDITEQNINIKYFEKIEKANWHSHSGKGGNINFLERQFGLSLSRRNEPFSSIKEMKHWITKEYGFFTKTNIGMLKCWEACFAEANRDNYSKMVQSFSIDAIESVGGMSEFIKIMNSFKEKYCPKTRFFPELRINRNPNKIDISKIDEMLSYNFFTSMDLCGDEQGVPVENFIPVFRLGEKYNLDLLAHIGEQLDTPPEEIVKTISLLHLNGIYHGITAAKSKYVMKWLKKNDIVVHICPTSNVMLSVVKDFNAHPIRLFVNEGLDVTINTDDLLVFNSTLSEEYFKLYTNNVLSLDEIKKIIQFSLMLERG